MEIVYFRRKKAKISDYWSHNNLQCKTFSNTRVITVKGNLISIKYTLKTKFQQKFIC